MICNQLKRIQIFFLFSTAIILVVTESHQSESSNYHPTQLFESLLRKWQQYFDKTKWISKIDVDKPDVHISASIEKQETGAEHVLHEGTAVIGSIVPMEENFLIPQFFGIGRQQISACTCKAIFDGFIQQASCSTTCATAQTPCDGRVCSRTTIFSAFSSNNDFLKEFQSIDESDCESLTFSCFLSSALASATSPSASIAITTAVANVAMAAGIAAGAVALGLAAKSKETHDFYEDHYYETEHEFYEIDDETEYDAPKYYAKRQARGTVLDVSYATPGEIEDENELLADNQITGSIMENYSNSGQQLTGSIMGEPNYSNSGQQLRQSGCNCVPEGSDCTTTCYSNQQLCGGLICTTTTVVTEFFFNPVRVQFKNIYSNDCVTLNDVCSLSSALNQQLSTAIRSYNSFAAFALVAGALTAGLSAGNIVAVAKTEQQSSKQTEQLNQLEQQQQFQQLKQSNQPTQQHQTTAQQIPNQTLIVVLPMPVIGADCQDDGCDDNSVRLPGGHCRAIFSSCNDTNYWVTFDNATRLQDGCGTTGKCTPRLCDDRRVFVGRTGLCHDINDPIECPGGRRLYYSAFGDSICDCPIGQFPFPNPEDNCVPLFTRGPCPRGQVVTLSHGGRLFCAPDECQSQINEESLLSLVPSDRGQCQAIGSRGSCSSGDSQFLGYDIFKRQLQCRDVSSSCFLGEKELQKNIFSDQLQIERNRKMSDDLTETTHQSSLSETNLLQDYRRQDTVGIFQVPSPTSVSLLQPCRTGVRHGLNQKCSNPLVSISENRAPLSPVPPLFSCPAYSFLQAGGECVTMTA